jgi:hypothetical protein
MINGYRKEILMHDIVSLIGVRNYVLFSNRIKNYNFFHPEFIKTKTIFIHVPKAAGSSIGQFLYGTPTTGHFEWNYYKIEDSGKFEEYFKFTFVREPISRFMSAYNYLLSGGRSTHDREVGEKIRTYGGVDSFVRQGLRDGPFLKFRHFRPQSYFLFDDSDTCMVDFIGRVETLKADTEALSKIMRRDLDINVTNATKKISAHSNELSINTIKILQSIYDRDFRLLEYPLPWVH